MARQHMAHRAKSMIRRDSAEVTGVTWCVEEQEYQLKSVDESAHAQCLPGWHEDMTGFSAV